MKVKVLAEIILDIPGEFQEDAMAVAIIDQQLRDQLYVGCDYELNEETDTFHVHELAIRSYIVLSGRIPVET